MKLSRTKTSPVPCAAWANRLAALHPDDLTPDEQMALKHHLASCSDCADVYAAYQQVDARILSLPLVQPSAQQVAQVETLITDQTAHDRSRKSLTHPLEDSPLPTRRQTPSAHVEQRLSALAAILVVMVLAVSAFALFSSRHTSSVLSTVPGTV
ncbi:MAG: zf-HC2 domain-containing protein, partial [Chloroflexi bacterium]|nr:zf-HC2 domain-containing protein [Chloroflexota bacterium]